VTSEDRGRSFARIPKKPAILLESQLPPSFGIVIAKLADEGRKPEGIRGETMKKLTVTVICLIVLSMSALPLAAQTRNRACNNRTVNTGRYNTGRYNTGRYNTRYDERVNQYDPRYDNTVYSSNDVIYDEDGYPIYDDNRSVWDKHRDKITTVAGAAGGAAIGGMFGGKKGAILGAIAGGAGAAIYTYKIRDKYPRY
jgi:hypothetical protein